MLHQPRLVSEDSPVVIPLLDSFYSEYTSPFEDVSLKSYTKMQEFHIKDEELTVLEGAVIVVTGCSSGIGLATVQLLLQLKAKVVGGDQNPGELSHANFSFLKTDVTSWPNLLALFEHAEKLHGRVDHVFSNAGIAGRADYLKETYDDNGALMEPAHLTYDINLRGMINTSYLGLTYFRRKEPAKGSIVCTASASSFQRFRVCDYTTAKHGVLGWMRGMVPNLVDAGLAIRVNAVAPSWTRTGLVPPEMVKLMEAEWQDPDVVARSVAILMADEARQGQLIYSWGGRFAEIEEQVFLPEARKVVGKQDDDAVVAQLLKAVTAAQQGA